MPKPDGRVRAKLAVRPARKRAPPPDRRQRASAEDQKPAKRSSRSDAERLAAEVERLQRQLEAARRRLVLLEAHADIDLLTGLANRRAFERELARALAY